MTSIPIPLISTRLLIPNGEADESIVAFCVRRRPLLSWAEVRRKVATDPRIPEKRRAGVLSSLTRFPAWVGQDAGVSSKRLQNARSGIRFCWASMGAHAGIWRRSPRPRSGCGTCSIPVSACSLSRLLRFLSAQDVDPARITEQVSQRFLEALRMESRLRLKAEVFHQSAIRAWNKAVLEYPKLATSRSLGAALPSNLGKASEPSSHDTEQAVDRFLRKVPPHRSCSMKPAGPRSAPATQRTRKQHFRCAASALVNVDIPERAHKRFLSLHA